MSNNPAMLIICAKHSVAYWANEIFDAKHRIQTTTASDACMPKPENCYCRCNGKCECMYFVSRDLVSQIPVHTIIDLANSH